MKWFIVWYLKQINLGIEDHLTSAQIWLSIVGGGTYVGMYAPCINYSCTYLIPLWNHRYHILGYNIYGGISICELIPYLSCCIAHMRVHSVKYSTLI